MRRNPGRLALALCLLTAAGAAAQPAPAPGEAPCRPERSAYWQALTAYNPPEVVDITMSAFDASLGGLPTWNTDEIARRQAMDDKALAAEPELLRANPAAVEDARLSRCLIAAEIRRRQAQPR